MGQQQLLIIVLGVIMVAVAIAVGITIFGSSSVASNKDALVNAMNNLSADAYRYRLLPSTLGGGGRTFTGYIVPSRLDSTEDGTFAPTTPVTTPDAVTFVATSNLGFGTITAVLDRGGKLSSFSYTGDFQ